MDNNKYQYMIRARQLATQAAQVLGQLAEMVAVWDDRLYGPGAANELTAADLTSSGDAMNPNPSGTAVTPNDLYAMVIAASQLGKFIEGDPAAVPGPYSATINRLRQDM